MDKLLAVVFFLIMALGSAAHAQTSRYGGIRESTDPQRAEEIENKARQISGQSTSETGAASTTPGTPTETKKAAGKKKKIHKKMHKKTHKKSRKHMSSGASSSVEMPSSTEKKTEETQPTK